jgi:predicted nucleic acid-binding protein
VIAPDSSVAIAAVAPWHEAHEQARAALTGNEVRLPAHVAFEATSVLSRMPKGRRIAAEVVLTALEQNFLQPWLTMDAPGWQEALRRAVMAGVRGGALYDALIAATAASHDAEMVSTDRRALSTYRAMGVDVRLIGL